MPSLALTPVSPALQATQESMSLPTRPVGAEETSDKPRKSKKRKSQSEVVQVDTAQETATDAAQKEAEVVAESHKALRKKRKLEKSGIKPAETVVASEREQPAKRSGHGIWVGNMSYMTNESQLRQFFDVCGEITRIHLPEGKQKYEVNRGFAYIDFETAEATTKAIAMSEQNLIGRKLLIKDASNFEGRPATPANKATEALLASGVPLPAGTINKTSNSLSRTAKEILDRQTNDPAQTLFVGNLSFEATDALVRALFDNNAHAAAQSQKPKRAAASSSEEPEDDNPDKFTAGIRKVRLGTFEDTGKCKGWAFVDFIGIPQATAALLNPRNHRMHNRALKVEYGSAEAVRRGGGPRAKPDKKDDPAKPAAPPPKIDFAAPPEKVHKPTQEERRAAREAKAKSKARKPRDVEPRKRVKPGDALSQAPRERTAIVPGAAGRKVVFE
ncbi:uncharacterized protein L969DRAFT_46925 [Mixia osmundae IAM 14324]|uniref:RRM domain-containing protein n=1 Tax=Mixia osmundae (strain CBS 9802 / IAM 14324 / JCM 22182 / KY 12970) TaxID=764103 RepID=G7E5B7_MIXOS|nr:uncharacterized protein L969DRAFT_46925 [Mixia osmundae IAM 14324]KEI40823.1 hypothetical protein L969DRAFT_46925 [Mixia osmundae IAM 14324]GAA98027.1 hypothetical protein E5Q_04707 [Mixia osmundae IAM 14324]